MNESAQKKAVSSSDVARLDTIEILCGQRLPRYDVGPVQAYQAFGKNQDQERYFALVCEKHLVPRSRMVSVYASFSNPSLVPLVTAGIVYWPPAKQERYVLVYRDILGKRILKPGDPLALGWRPDDVLNCMAKPMIKLLQDMRDKDMVHGAIRPTNMYEGDKVGNKLERVILGDCLATPPSSMQPVLFEAVERSMASPIGRGVGTLADDIYSFGVCLAVFLRTHDPLEGMSDDEIIEAKIENGTYGAITGKDRFRGSILELLRGVLIDDQSQRWTIDEILTWLDGRRLSPKQPIKHKKAPRPVVFNDKKYFQIPVLAMDIDKSPPETKRIVDNEDLEQWLARSMEDEEVLARALEAIKTARDRGIGPGYDERLVSYLSIALDPNGPIRFKGLRLRGDGVGYALAESVALKKDLNPYADMFAQGIAIHWITMQNNSSLDVSSLISRFDQSRACVRQTKIGFGIERCLYVLCPEIHCMSEKLKDYYVRTPEEMIVAFEDMCKKGSAPVPFLDRHSIAFLAVRDPKMVELYMYDLSASEIHRKVMGNLKCLAMLQKRSNIQTVPAVAKAFVAALPVVYERFHDRQIRGRVEKMVSRYASEGDLVKMAATLSNAEILSADQAAFRAAMAEYSSLRQEYEVLQMQMGNKSAFGKMAGKEISAGIASMVALMAILGMILMTMTGKSFF